MSRWIVAPSGLIEPVAAPEIYVDGIGAIEEIDDHTLRVYFYVEQLPIEAKEAIVQKAVALKMIRSVNSIPTSIGQLAKALFNPNTESVRGKPRLV